MEGKNPVELFDMKLAHVGMNANGEEEAIAWGKQFEDMLGLTEKVGNSSVFADTLVEIMKQNGRGTHGHIGFTVNDLDKAVAYFEARGMHTVPETIKYNEDGTMKFTYFAEEIGGFAIHMALKK